MAGQGNPGLGGGKAGDLILEIQVKEHVEFKRENNDIHSDVKVPLVKALMADKVSVNTIHGPVMLALPKNAQSGQVMRLKSKGIHSKNEEGNHYVRLLITYPEFSKEDHEKVVTILKSYSI